MPTTPPAVGGSRSRNSGSLDGRPGVPAEPGDPAPVRKAVLAEIKGRLAFMPTLFQVGGTMLAINAGIVAIAALAVTLLRS